MRRYIDAEKVAEELSKVPWYNRDDERQAVRIVKEFSSADNQLWVNENLISREQVIEKVKAFKIFAPTDGVEKTLNAVMDAIAHSIAELPAANATQHTECVGNALDEPQRAYEQGVQDTLDKYDETCRIVSEIRMSVGCKTAKECRELIRNGEIQRAKHGKWEWDGEYFCSVCGYREPHREPTFCGGCGAKMF